MSERLLRNGRILSIRDGMAAVRVDLPSACSACGSRGGCAGGRPAMVTVPAPDSLRVGDAVALTVDASALVGHSLIAYLMPAVATVAGALALASAGDAAAGAGALSGLGLALLALRVMSRRRMQRGAPVLTTSAASASQPTGEFT